MKYLIYDEFLNNLKNTKKFHFIFFLNIKIMYFLFFKYLKIYINNRYEFYFFLKKFKKNKYCY